MQKYSFSVPLSDLLNVVSVPPEVSTTKMVRAQYNRNRSTAFLAVSDLSDLPYLLYRI